MAHMTSRDSRNIYYESWQASSPRAVIQILTGLGEMSWYYEDLAKKANQLGFSVYLHEYRKHGRTEADYGDGNIFLTFASDAAQMLTRIRQENPGKKVFLVCHSLGTGIAQFAIAKEGARWDGIAMTGPSHRVIEPDRFDRLLKQAEQAILDQGPDAPSADIYPEIFDGQNDEFAEENSPFSFITSDRQKWDFIASLPFTSPDYSNRFYRDFLLMQAVMLDDLALEKQPAASPGITALPVLLLTGEQDITSEHGSYAAVKAAALRNAGFTDVTSKSYPGLRHSILQEVRRGEVEDDILAWIKDRL